VKTCSISARKEDVYAQYGQYQFGFGKLGVIAGLRVEETKVTYGGIRKIHEHRLSALSV